MATPESSGKPFGISKWEVWEAYKNVKANQGAPGVDGQTIEEFEKDLQGNLYRIWNRMSSGSYFPPPVLAVDIPKPHGNGTRTLGIPTASSRGGQSRTDGRGQAFTGEGRADLPPGFLWLSAETVGSGRSRGVPAPVLEVRLGG